MSELPQWLPSWTHLLIIPGIIAGFTVHELAHTLVAYLFGDSSQVERGRFTLNPLRHISWFGALTFVFFGFGWARPIQVDGSHFRRRYLGTFLVAVAGAAANLLLAGSILALTLVLVTLVGIFSAQNPGQILGLLLNVEADTGANILSWTAAFTTKLVDANLALAFFNLLPFPTLDGFIAMGSLIGMLRERPDGSEPIPDRKRPGITVLAAPAAPQAPRRPAQIHFEMGAQLHAEGNYADAIARYRQAIANDRRFGPAYVNLGLAYLALNQRAHAIQALRGATQYAADEKSKKEAWAQLHKLSEFRPLTAEDASSSSTAAPPQALPEAGPWTDTQHTPNWLAFGLTSLLVLTASGCVYIYLTISLIRYLSP
jgi:Zn-dependent protease